MLSLNARCIGAVLRGTARQILDIMESRDAVKGEITLLIAKADRSEAPLPEQASVGDAVAACERVGGPRET